MPRKYRRRKARKTRYRKRPYAHNDGNPDGFALYRGPVMPKKKATLKYSELIQMDDTALTAVQAFSANGCFDPNITGTGHQPYGFDQWMAFYDHYTVIGSKIKVTFATNEVADYRIVTISKDDNATLLVTTHQSIIEKPGCSWKYQGIAGQSNSNSVTLTSTFSAKKDLGISKPMASSISRGTAASNPTEQSYWHITSRGVSGFPAVQNHVLVEIIYSVIFTEPKEFTSS